MNYWKIFLEIIAHFNFKKYPIIFVTTCIFFIISIILLPIFNKNNIVELSVNYIKDKSREDNLTFNKNEFGIFIAPFLGEKENNNFVSSDFVNTLNQRFRYLKLNDTVAKSISSELPEYVVTNEKKAIEIGIKHNARIVIWGSVTKKGILPNIMIIETTNGKENHNNIALFKDTLRLNLNIESNNNIAYPELIDEPTAIVAFSLANKFVQEERYDKAIEYFIKALPIVNSTIYFDDFKTTEAIYYKIALCYVALGQIKNAESTLINNTKYKNDKRIISLLGFIRNLSGIIKEEALVDIINIGKKFNISDIRYWDEILISGWKYDEAYANTMKYKPKDDIDHLVEKLLLDNKFSDRFSNINKTYDAIRNKKLEYLKNEFDNVDFENKIALIGAVISIDADYALKLIKSAEDSFGKSSVFTIFKILISIKDRNLPLIKELLYSDKKFAEESVFGRIIAAMTASFDSDKLKSLTILNNIIKESPNCSLARKMRIEINYELGIVSKVIEDYEEYWNKNKKTREDIYNIIKLLIKENELKFFNKFFLKDDEFKIYEKYYNQFREGEDTVTNFNDTIETILNGEDYSKASSMIDAVDYSNLQRILNFLNNNELTRANELITEILKSDVVINNNKLTAIYKYCLAFIHVFNPNHYDGNEQLFESYIAYPSKTTLDDVTASFINEADSNDIYPALFKFLFERYREEKNITKTRYKNLVTRLPKFCYLMYNYSIYLNYAGEKESVEIMNNALECNNNIKGANFLLARMIESDNIKGAIDNYHKSITIDGENLKNVGALSKCYEEIGDIENAKEYSNKLRSLYFKNDKANPLEYFFNLQYR